MREAAETGEYLSRAKNRFRPWWRRRAWPLACGSFAVLLLALFAWSFVRHVAVTWSDRVVANLSYGWVNLKVMDAEYAATRPGTRPLQPGWRCTQTPLGDDRWSGFGKRLVAFPTGEWNRVNSAWSASQQRELTFGRTTSASIPLGWPIALFGAICGLGLCWQWMRRWRIGTCRRCAYHRAGLAGAAVCPECGTGP
jgi:hypothetical protein